MYVLVHIYSRVNKAIYIFKEKRMVHIVIGKTNMKLIYVHLFEDVLVQQLLKYFVPILLSCDCIIPRQLFGF